MSGGAEKIRGKLTSPSLGLNPEHREYNTGLPTFTQRLGRCGITDPPGVSELWSASQMDFPRKLQSSQDLKCQERGATR
jgi:hypothetical protein